MKKKEYYIKFLNEIQQYSKDLNSKPMITFIAKSINEYDSFIKQDFDNYDLVVINKAY